MRKPLRLTTKVVALLLITLSTLSGFSQIGNYHYNDSWGKSGLQIDEQRSSDIQLTFSIQDFSIAATSINGENMHQIVLSSQILPNNSGAPNLPGNGYMLAIPNGATARVEVVNSRKEIIENVLLEPAPEIPWDTDPSPIRYSKNQDIYSTNAFYPKNPVIVSEPGQLRGVNVIRLGITPYQYNPVTHQLVVLRDLEIKVITEDGDGNYGTERLRSRWWDPILKNSIVNSQVLPQVDYSQNVANASRSEEYEYLIISPNDSEFVSWADSISRFRNMQGIHTGVVTMSEINAVNALALEAYINTIYAEWATPPAAILLLGDYGTDMDNTVISPIWDNYCASDNILSDVDGDDLPDIVLARITAQNAAQLEVMINKFIHYETNPPTNFDFYDHPITALGWQTERWFQICSETVGGFWKNELGKHPVRINEVYDGNPDVDPWSYATNTASVMNYFGPNGLGYITATPGELGDWRGGDAGDVNNAINAGSFMLQHRDHGYEAGWGEPGYNSGSISGLHNTDLTFVFSINCLTGKYNYGGEVFTEKFHRYTFNGEASGALGLIAASEVSYSFVNDAYVWGLYDYMWPEFMPDYGGDFPETHGVLPAFANAYGKIFLEYTGWPYNTGNKAVTYNLFHHHGDAFLNVYTEVPQELTVSSDEVILSGLPTFNITADAGSLICLSANGEILAVADATGEPQTMDIPYVEPGTMVDLVITKQNYFRYHQQLLCVPPSGPYLLNVAQVIQNIEGNDFMCFGDEGKLSLTIKNVGTETANDVVVTISSEDEFVQITDNSETYGAITADQSMSIEDGFSFEIAENTPDQHAIVFHVEAASTESSWTSEVTFVVNAPSIQLSSFQLREVSGNANGIVDAGETYEIQFDVKNEGHAATKSMTSSMETASDMVRIYTDPFSTEVLQIDSTISNTYVFEVDGNTSLGDELVFNNNIVSGAYGFSYPVYVKVGVTIEDWETGDLSKFEWLNDAAHPWVIDPTMKYEDNFSLRSGDISESQVSVLTLPYELDAADSVSFYKKTATIEGNGELIFLVDNQEKARWSGDTDWSRVSFPLSAGKHTLVWFFIKYTVSNELEDCAWIDLIHLPQTVSTTAWAGFDTETCEVAEIQLEGMATEYTSLLWTTDGTGSFNDSQILNPMYMPSDEDYQNGQFTLTLTAEASDGAMVSDSQTYLVLMTPEAAAILWEQDSVYTVLTPSTVIEGEAAAYAGEYVWMLTPETSGTMTYDGQMATIDWNTLYSGEATIGYQGLNMCGEGELTEKMVFVSNATDIAELNNVQSLSIFPNPNNGSFIVSLQLTSESAIQLQLLDGVGREVWKQNVAATDHVQVNCHPTKLPAGFYQLIIHTENQRLVKKIVVQ